MRQSFTLYFPSEVDLVPTKDFFILKTRNVIYVTPTKLELKSTAVTSG